MTSLHFDDYTLNPVLRQLSRGDVPVPLSGKAFDVLLYLASNPGRPLLKSEILSAVWPDSFVEESNLNQSVFLIRKALGAEGERLIVTLPRRGYQFTAKVDEHPAFSAPVPAPVELTTQTLEATHSRVIYEEEVEERFVLHRSPLGIASVALVLILVAATAWLGWQRWEDRVGGPPVQVVLADLDGGTGDTVLDRALQDSIRIELAQSPFVSLVPAATVRSTLLQMLRKPDDPLTVQTAREVCERTASQAVLHTTVAHAGGGYLLTDEAVSCVDGSTLATARREVSRVDDLPGAIVKTGATIRHGLGESRRTIARFNAPLIPAATGSLEALKDYSQGGYLGRQGKFTEAIELVKQAVAIDPKFATAWLDLSLYASNLGDYIAARGYLQKAYDTRDAATEPAKLYIVARYHSEISGDLYESLRNYQAWINLYPKQPQPWSGLANVLPPLGRTQEAVEASKRLVELIPGNASVYFALANDEMRNGNFPAAKAACDLGIARHFDSDNLRHVLLRLGHLQHDPALIAEQESWLTAHPDSPFLIANMSNYALNEGRVEDSIQLLERMNQVFVRMGQPTAGTRILQGLSSNYAELGRDDLAKQFLHAGPVDEEELDDLRTLAETGDPAGAAAMMKDELAKHPQSTMWNGRSAPLLRGILLLIEHKPREAVAAMEPSRQLDGADADGYYLRGKAYLEARELPQAEKEFRTLLAHPQVEPTAFSLPMAQLQLARVLALEGRRPEAIEAYQAALKQWEHADAGFPVLKQAKDELAALQAKPA